MMSIFLGATYLGDHIRATDFEEFYEIKLQLYSSRGGRVNDRE